MSGPLTPAVGPRLCAELIARCAVPGAPINEVEVRVDAFVRPDLAAVDALARLRLTARRQGCELVVKGAGRELLDLLDAVGLGALVEDRSSSG